MPSANRQDLFHPDPGHGALRRPDGGRLSAISGPFLHALHAAIAERFPDDAPDVLYRAGYEQGLQDLLRLSRELRESFGASFDFWQADPKFVLESWWAPLARAGWGHARFDLGAPARQLVVIEVVDGLIPAALGPSGQPMCHHTAGAFAGALSFFERAERHAIELACVADGADRCTFVVAPGPIVDAAEASRQEGVAPAEILQRLR